MHHGGGRRGRNAHHVGFAPLDKINQLAGRGRKRGGLRTAFARRQQLRQHHAGDFIRLVASGQAQDARPRRVAVLGALFRLRFRLVLTPFVNHLLQALKDELVPALVQFAAMPVALGQSQGRDDQRVVDLDKRPVLKFILDQFGCR